MNPTLQKLKGNKSIKFVTKDSELGELEWVIKPVPFTLLLENFDKFTDMPETADNLSADQAKKLQANVYPLMKQIIPRCIVDPKIAINEEDAGKEDYLHIDDIPFQSVVDVFNKIIEITGLDKAGEDARKKLPAQQ